MNDQLHSWKRYPYGIGDDPQLVFPAAEGDQGAESNTYYVAGRLRGCDSGREYAFLVIFTFNNIRQWLRADFYTCALFDLETGAYGTYTEFDLPWPPRLGRGLKLTVGTGSLDVSFNSREGLCTWAVQRNADGTLRPFVYQLCLYGRDQNRQRMHVRLELDTYKPPMPVGGHEYGGVKTCIGQYGTHSYFQSDVRFRGMLEWGSRREAVEGDCGWIDRQWTPRYLGVHNDWRNTRYRHEWRQLHLDNGVEMSVWLHYDRHRGNRVIPFSAATAAFPGDRVMTTTDVTLQRLSFVRDPASVRPLLPLGRGPKYLADRYRLIIPPWGVDVYADPLVATPAHALPIEYWSGPIRVAGRMSDEPVRGFGFHERTFVFTRDFELVDVLRESVRHLPESAVPTGGSTPLNVANQIWEVDAFLSHHDRAGALRFLNSRVRPLLERFDVTVRPHILQIADDLALALRK